VHSDRRSSTLALQNICRAIKKASCSMMGSSTGLLEDDYWSCNVRARAKLPERGFFFDCVITIVRL
jgi:hypothetical protein